jgi:hypothetical protein
MSTNFPVLLNRKNNTGKMKQDLLKNSQFHWASKGFVAPAVLLSSL